MKPKDAETLLKKLTKKLRGGNVMTRPLGSRLELVLPDTCALIDLEQITASYKGSEARYARSDLFLNSIIDANRMLIISQGVMEEIRRHARIKVNSNDYELSPLFVAYLEEARRNTEGALPFFRYGRDAEQAGLDVFWASKISCEKNCKKQEEGFSEEDKEQLKLACLLQNARLICPDSSGSEREVESVHILSCDCHLCAGSKFLIEQCNYPHINCINFRDLV